MTDGYTTSPGGMSAEAVTWLKNVGEFDPRDLDKTPIEVMRIETHEANRPAAEAAIRQYGVTTWETEIGGVRCLIIDPPARRSNRVLIYLFGGGFILGSPVEDLPISASLAVKTEAQVIVPYYRLAPEHPFPAALDDITAVAKEVLSSEGNICLVGESAGGNLALALMNRLRSHCFALPRAVALLSPASDLCDKGDSIASNAARDPTLSPKLIKQVTAAYAGGQELTNPEVSPVYGTFDSAFPPVLITTGTYDLLLGCCVRLARVMREAGVPVELRVWEGMWHVFEFYSEIPESDASLTDIAEFLETAF